MLPNSAHDRIAPHGRTTSMASGGAVSRLLGSEDPVRAEARRLLAERGPATYIGDILAERDGALTRWPDRDGKPLVVWIQDKTNIPGWMASYVDDVRGAFQDWDAVKVPVHFAFTTDSAKADVHVTFIDHFDEPISGRTKWERDEDWWITDANIVLAVAHHDGVMLDDDAMHAMTLHEVGHLIGLDHTKDPLSVMAPRVRVRELSRADRATAQLLYALPPGPMNK
jgi:hypothetical protein